MPSSIEEGNHPTEKSALLSKESSVSIGLTNDNVGEFNEESIEVAKMKQVTHNDPQLRADDEDYKNLLGSTRLLYNATVEEELTAEMRRKSSAAGGINSMGGTMSNHIINIDDGSSNNNKNNGHDEEQQPPLNDFKSRVARMSTASSRASQGLSLIYNKQRDNATLFLEKVKHSFFEDSKSLAAGTIPQSVVVATVIGVVCGVACWIYYTILFFFLEYLWKTLPEQVVEGKWPEELHWLWIPLVSFVMITCVGLTVVYMGEPGDLPYTIGRVHAQAFIPMDHVHPMAFSSLFSILGKYFKLHE
jgi:hypothetical protein